MAGKDIPLEREKHTSLMCDLHNALREAEFRDVKQITVTLGVISANRSETLTTFFDFWYQLESQGNIKVGEYSFLIKQLTRMKLMKCVEIVQKYQEDIKNLLQAHTLQGPAEIEKLEERLKKIEDKVENIDLSKTSSTAGDRKCPRDIRRCRLVFEKTYTFDIRCIANLGNRFAVAYPRRASKIDVYDYQGVWQHTITEHIPGLWKMAPAPGRKIAVLCKKENEEGEWQFCVNTFDIETGSHLACTPGFDLSNLSMYPDSFDVNSRGEYYIMEGHDVTVIREDGSLVLKQSLDKVCFRLSCGGEHVFIKHIEPNPHIVTYEVKENRLVPVARSETFERVWDVSATSWGEVTVTCLQRRQWYLGRSVMQGGRFADWQYYQIFDASRSNSFVSVRGEHIVISRGRTIQVFAEEGS